MRIFGVVLLAVVSLGCSAKPTVVCSTKGSALHVGPAGDTIPLDDACSYEVTKRGDTPCAGYDVTIHMTAYTGGAQPQTLTGGLVYTVSSLDRKGPFLSDPSQLCTSGGYYSTTGDWVAGNSTSTDVPWPAPESIDSIVPAFQTILVNGIYLAHEQVLGGINLTLSRN